MELSTLYIDKRGHFSFLFLPLLSSQGIVGTTLSLSYPPPHRTPISHTQNLPQKISHLQAISNNPQTIHQHTQILQTLLSNTPNVNNN